MVVSERSHRGSTVSVAGFPEFTGQSVVLLDRYNYADCVEDLIGIGSFGIVFKGKDTVTNKDVAVKRMSPLHIKENELKVVRRLKNRYLVGVMDICRLDDTCFVIMELCDADLAYHIKERATNGKLKPRNLSRLLDNIARGYKALYDQRIVHRDIKPQNILVKYEAGTDFFHSAKITDFVQAPTGVARTLDDDNTTELCNVAGTLFYMAPEVGANLLKTCQYDSKVDMWSIGCLIYQCLTGDIPFDECALCRIFLYTACTNYDAYDPPGLPEHINDHIATVIVRLLQIDPSLRCTPNQFYETVISWDNPIMS